MTPVQAAARVQPKKEEKMVSPMKKKKKGC